MALNEDQLRLVLSRPDGRYQRLAWQLVNRSASTNPDAENETDTVEHSRETLRQIIDLTCGR